MKKLQIMWILFATFIVPMRAARASSAVQGLQRSFAAMAVCIAVYIVLVTVFNK